MTKTSDSGTWGRKLRVLVLVPAIAGCVSAPRASAGSGDGSPTRPSSEKPAPDVTVSPAADDSALAVTDAGIRAVDSLAAADSSVVDFDSLVAEVRSRSAIERQPSVLPFGIIWSPSPVQEGSAVAFRVLQPRGGQEPTEIEGAFAGHSVRFARIGKIWVGIGAVPIGATGTDSLRLRFRFASGEGHEQSAAISIHGRTWDRTNMRVAPQYSSPPPEVRTRIARDREQIRAVLDTATSEWLVDGPFVVPRPYDVTSPFGQERVFNGELQSRHTGLDLRGTVGTPVFAAGRGRVALTGDFYFSGNGIFIDHGLGVYTGYFHLSEILVAAGDMVEKGDLIGRVGASGRVTGPHLHWSLWVDGTGLDASSLLGMKLP